jgi:hypothetical protein
MGHVRWVAAHVGNGIERGVYIRRSFIRGELTHPKTEASMRAVPQARALDALDRRTSSRTERAPAKALGGASVEKPRAKRARWQK